MEKTLNKKFLILIILFLISGCHKKEINKGINEDFNKQIQIIENSFSPEITYSAYKKANSYLEEIYLNLNLLMKNSFNQIDEYKYNIQEKYLNDLYWKNHDTLMISLKKCLENDNNYNYLKNYIDVDFYKNIKIDSLFFSNCKIEDINLNLLIDKIYEQINKINKNELSNVEFLNSYEVISKFINFYFNQYNRYNLLSDLYIDKSLENYEYIYLHSSEILSLYQNYIKNILLSNYKSLFLENYNFSIFDQEYYLNLNQINEETLSLLNEENKLKNEYLINKNQNNENYDYKHNLLELIKIRNNIAKMNGYNNYLEYIWSDYSRDYTLKESLNLISYILNNKDLFYFYYYFNKEFYFSSYKEIILNEDDYFNFLNYSNNILNTSFLIDELRTYGNYNFQSRTNKNQNRSYVDLVNSKYFIYISGKPNQFILPTISHEFGHYVGLNSYIYEPTISLKNLDLCEVHSQGLEYLMTNYYKEIFPEEITNSLIYYLLNNAIWTILSASYFFFFENYIYANYENINISMMDEKFEIIQNKLNVNLSYINIPHFYISPGYYISYLISIIPSLEIFSLPFEEGKYIYKKIIDYGPYHNFNEVISSCNLITPFSFSSLELIINKFKQIKTTI